MLSLKVKTRQNGQGIGQCVFFLILPGEFGQLGLIHLPEPVALCRRLWPRDVVNSCGLNSGGFVDFVHFEHNLQIDGDKLPLTNLPVDQAWSSAATMSR